MSCSQKGLLDDFDALRWFGGKSTEQKLGSDGASVSSLTPGKARFNISL